METLSQAQLEIVNDALADFQGTVQAAIGGGTDVELSQLRDFRDQLDGIIQEFEVEMQDTPETSEEGEED